MQINQHTLNKAKEILKSNDFKDELKSKLNKSNNIISEEVKNNLTEDKIIIEDGLNKEVFTPEIVKEFIDFCKKELNIVNQPILVRLADNRNGFTTFAYYSIGNGEVHVYANNRAFLDVCRSAAHEIAHLKQDIDNRINDDNSHQENDGVDIENEANAKAGEIIRKFGRKHKFLYDK